MVSRIVINSDLLVEHSAYLGKECSKDGQDRIGDSPKSIVRGSTSLICNREKGIMYANKIYNKFDNLLYFSISIPPECIVKIRGRPREYRQLTVDSQYYYFQHRIIQCGEDNNLKNCLFIPEHTFEGNVHFHVLCSGEEYRQTYKAIFLNMFNIDVKKFSVKNINCREVDNIFLNVSYLTKDPLDYCINKGDDFSIVDFNKSILDKQFEKSIFNWIYFEEKEI